MRVSKKILFQIVLVITLIVQLLISAVVMNSQKTFFSKKEYDNVTASIYETVVREISNPIYTSMTMAKNTFLIDVLENEENYSEEELVQLMAEYLTLLKDSLGTQTAFVVSEKTHRYYYYDGLNKYINPEVDEHDVWYTIFTNTRKPYDLDVDTDQLNRNSWTVFVNTRIEDTNKKLLGVCGIGISMDKLQEMLSNYEKKFGLKVNFINSEGVVQVDTDSVNIENAYLYDVQYGREKDGYSYKNANGEYVIMRYVDDLNWYLVIRGYLRSITFKEILPLLISSLIVILVNIFAFYFLFKKETSDK